MWEGLLRKGFTLLELTISMLFVSLLSISIVVVINNVIMSYQRGAVLSRLEGVGNSIVDDMRSAVQDALNTTRLGENISITKTTRTMKINGENKSNIPIYGIFCSGSYTYFWNSGYFFTNDAEFDEKNDGWAKIQLSTDNYYNPNNIDGRPTFRVVKVQDTERAICISTIKNYGDSSKTIDNNKLSNIFNISELNNPVIVDLLQTDNDNDLALYDLAVDVPATNYSESLSLYNISFILGTTTGGIDIATDGNACATPIGNATWSNSCAVSRFNFAVQSNATDIGAVEQVFYGEVPNAPEVTPPPVHKINYNKNCPNGQNAIRPVTNTGLISDNLFKGQCGDDALFVEWNTQSDGTGLPYQPGDAVDQEKDLTLYAIWKVNNYYTITYHGNGNTTEAGALRDDTAQTAPILEGTKVNLIGNRLINVNGSLENWPIRRGYDLLGWGTSASDTSPTLMTGAEITLNSDLVLYAVWGIEGDGLQNQTGENTYTTDRFVNALLVFPNFITSRDLLLTGNHSAEDTDIRRYRSNTGDEFIDRTGRDYICEAFNAQGSCGDTATASFATIYLLRQNSTSSSILYMPINESKKIDNTTKNQFAFYLSDALSFETASTKACASNTQLANGKSYTGEPVGLCSYPFRYYFPQLPDTLIAKEYFPATKRIYGKDAQIEGSSPKYWIIARLRYNSATYTLTYDPINVFTSTSPTNY